MAESSTAGEARHLGGTLSGDAWWLELLPVIALLGAFGMCATLRAFEGKYYDWGPYLSPFYSPLIDPYHRWWPFSPALLILLWPLGFRVTCRDGESPYVIHRDLQENMQNLVGIFRNQEDLVRALEELEKLKERAEQVSVGGSRLFNPGWHLAQDLNSLLIVSEAVTRSALARQESRGAHSRIDYPGLDATWGARNNVTVREESTMALRQSPVPEMPDDLKQLLADDK